MIKLLPNLSDDTIGLVASGRVSGHDYASVVVPAVEAALRKHTKLKLLYELGTDFTDFAPGAVWDDMKLGMAHLSAWEKVAVVTDVGWVANATNLFKFVIPCAVKVFHLKDRAEAEAWIAA